MPTVARFGGLRLIVYPNDHRPPHAHVLGHGQEAIFFLNCPNGPPELRANYGFSLRELNAILENLQTMIDRACEMWRRFHGSD